MSDSTATPRRFLPSMNLLSAFEAAARYQSFTTAAHELDLTQSAVSRQIRSLEEILGANLFVRERQIVRLTSAGEAYAREIRYALRQISSATLGFRANPYGQSLNLDLLPTFGTRWLIPRLSAFMRSHPNIRVNLFSRSSGFEFSTTNTDAAIHFGEKDWTGVDYQFLMGETVVPVCSKAFWEQHTIVEPKDLIHLPLLHLVSRPDAWEKWFASMDVSIPDLHGMLLDQFHTAAQAAAADLGVALLPTLLVEHELANGDLVSLFEASVKSGGSYYLVWPCNRADYRPLQLFRSWLASATSGQSP